MPIDYDKIRDENIRRYGTDVNVYGPTLLEGQYSDLTHFIYELLQNAEDAEATQVKFRLSPHRLKLEHNGRTFNEADVIGICGLVRGTKGNDLTKIGKFGIGFKSVYAHTNSPRIHCGNEHFLIRNYVHPYKTDARSTGLGTLFVFPFNRTDRTKEKSFSAISNRLRDLGVETLLFLRNIKRIEYKLADGHSGVIKCQTEEILEEGFATKVKLIEENDIGNVFEELWLVFRRDVPIQVQDKEVRLNVEIAFLLADDQLADSLQIRPLSRSDLVVYFPTAMSTGLGYLIQGPYRTNTARDRIADDTPFNARLILETGELVVHALRWLRDKNWLSARILETMPLKYSERESYYDHSYRTRFRESTVQTFKEFLDPVYQKFKAATFTEALIPALGGGFVAAKDAKTVEGTELRNLLESANNREVFDVAEDTKWIAEEITPNRTPKLWRFLTTTLKVEEFDTEKFVRRIDLNFMRHQTDEWVRTFYEFAPTSDTIKGILLDKPMIRLKDGSHVKPDRAYLPSNYRSGFPTVKQEVCNSTKSLKFLMEFGIKKPDIVDEVIKLVLPKYSGETDIDDFEHTADVALIVKALSVDSRLRKEELESNLENTPFLKAKSATGDSAYRSPKDLYIRTSELELYFEGNPNAWFLSPGYEQFHEDLLMLGVENKVRISLRSPSWNGHVTIRSWYGDHKRGLNGFDPDWEADSLEFAINHPNIRRCEFIWNEILIPQKHLIMGEIELSTRQNYSFSKIEAQVSWVGRRLQENAWLPDENSNYVAPSELTLQDLPESFRRDDELAEALGMRTARASLIDELLESDEISEEEKNKMKFALGLTAEEMKLIQEKRDKEREKPETLNPGDYPSEFEDAFDRIDATSRSRSNLGRSPQWKSPEERRINAESDISSEPDVEERYQEVIRRKWEPKNPETRRFLYNEYGGKCQICDDTFEKRDGENYFEAVHLIRRTSARFLDHQRNALCLCANHSAQFHAGEIDTPDEDIITDILLSDEGQPFSIVILLCKEPQAITFSPNHIDELRSGVEATEQL